MLERLVMIYSGFWRFGNLGLKNLQEWYGRRIYVIPLAVNRCFFTARPVLNMLCQNKGKRSRVARGYRS